MDLYLLLLLIAITEAKLFCGKKKLPLEIGEWRHHLKHIDSVIVENHPVSMSEGQVYVYENSFPGFTIKYIHVDNLAVKTCGASATIKNGGMGTSTIMIVLHAEANQEIRSVVDIWGTKNMTIEKEISPIPKDIMKNLKSLYLFRGLRVVNHNSGHLN